MHVQLTGLMYTCIMNNAVATCACSWVYCLWKWPFGSAAGRIAHITPGVHVHALLRTL